MGVLARFRKESPFKVKDRAKELEVLIVRICMNEKYFPKRYRFTMTTQIIEDAGKLADYVTAANALPLTEEFVKLRRRYQKEAYIRCECLLRRFDLAERMHFQIPDGVLTNVIGELVAEEKGITEWVKADKERMNKSAVEPCSAPEGS